MRRTFGMMLIALVGLTLQACGGLEPVERLAQSELPMVPISLLENHDLPGCEVLRGGEGVTEMLGYPGQEDLVVLTRDDVPLCVDTRDAALEKIKEINKSFPGGLPYNIGPGGDDDGSDNKTGSEGQGTDHTNVKSTKNVVADDPIPVFRDPKFAELTTVK